MPLQKQIVDYPFLTGIVESTDGKMLDRSGLARVVNGQFSKTATIDKRTGFVDFYGDIGVTPLKLIGHDGQLDAIVSTAPAYSDVRWFGAVNPQDNKYGSAGSVVPSSILERAPIAREYVETQRGDMGFCQGYNVYAFEDKSLGKVYVKIQDAKSRTVVYTTDQIGISPLVAVSGSHVMVAWANSSNINALIIAVSGGVVTVGSVLTLVTDRSDYYSDMHALCPMAAKAPATDSWCLHYIQAETYYGISRDILDDGSSTSLASTGEGAVQVGCYEEPQSLDIYLTYVSKIGHDLKYAAYGSGTHTLYKAWTVIASNIWTDWASNNYGCPIGMGPYTDPATGVPMVTVSWTDFYHDNLPPPAWIPGAPPVGWEDTADDNYMDGDWSVHYSSTDQQATQRPRAHTQWAKVDLTGSTTLPHNAFRLGAVSHPFVYRGVVYQWCVDVHTSAYVLYSVTNAIADCTAAYLAAPYRDPTWYTWSHLQLAHVSDDGTTGFHTALQVKTVNDEGIFKSAWSLDRLSLTFDDPHVWHTAELGDSLYLASSALLVGNGEGMIEHGAMQAPYIHAIMDQPTYPVGSLSFQGATGGDFYYGDNFVLDDGVNPPVTFVFDPAALGNLIMGAGNAYAVNSAGLFEPVSITSPKVANSGAAWDTATYSAGLAFQQRRDAQFTRAINVTTHTSALPMATFVSELNAYSQAHQIRVTASSVLIDNTYRLKLTSQWGQLKVWADNGNSLNNMLGWTTIDPNYTGYDSGMADVAIGAPLDPDVYRVIGYRDGVSTVNYLAFDPASTDVEMRDFIIDAVNAAHDAGVLNIKATAGTGAGANYTVTLTNTKTGAAGETSITKDFFMDGMAGAPDMIATAFTGSHALADSIGGGTYSYVACYEYVDTQGARYRSLLSDPFTIDLISYGDSGCQVSLKLAHNNTTRQSDNIDATTMQIAVYRTKKNGSVFYRLPFAASQVLNDPNATDFLAVTDVYGDSQLDGQETLYTQVDTGEIENHHLYGGAQFLVAHGDRLFAAGGENRTVVSYTKKLVPGQAIAWNPALFIDVGKTITGLASLDDMLLVFTADSIIGVYGEGPDNAGGSGTFEYAPIATDSGCIDANSILQFSAGVVYLSRRGLYLVDRSRQTTFFGQPVEDTVNAATQVISADVVQDSSQLRWVLRTVDGDQVLVYDYATMQWSTWTLAMYSPTNVKSTVTLDGVYLLCTEGGERIFSQLDNQYLDNGNWYGLTVETAWINFAGVQGFKRLRRWELLGDLGGPHGLLVDIYRDYTLTKNEQVSLPESTLVTLDPYQIRRHVAHQQSDAWKFVFTEQAPASPANLSLRSLTALSFEVGVKGILQAIPHTA